MDVIFEMEPNRMIILRDITELTMKEYNRSITKLTEIMVASTSHDMRTPLNTIINMHSLIEMNIKDPIILNWLKIAKSSSNLLLYLVNDTLDYFQIRSGKFKIKKGLVNIKELV
jgi:signal transduction histidine kinase